MNFLEKDLEEIIFNSDRKLLDERGLMVCGIAKRQLSIGNYGIADLVTFERDRYYGCVNITVYELKKDTIGTSAFMQAVGYVKGIKSYLEQRKFKHDVKFQIVLIGRKVDLNSNILYLEDLIFSFYSESPFLCLYTYLYDIDGIRFKPEYGFKLIKEGFKS